MALFVSTSITKGNELFNSDFTIDDNEYYTFVFDGTENWWKVVPKALANGLTFSFIFTLERPGRSVYNTDFVAATSVEQWINDNPATAPGGAGKYNNSNTNMLYGYLAVHDTSVFWRDYTLPA
jgi:hypothetical protein